MPASDPLKNLDNKITTLRRHLKKAEQQLAGHTEQLCTTTDRQEQIGEIAEAMQQKNQSQQADISALAERVAELELSVAVLKEKDQAQSQPSLFATLLCDVASLPCKLMKSRFTILFSLIALCFIASLLGAHGVFEASFTFSMLMLFLITLQSASNSIRSHFQQAVSELERE